MKRMKAIAWLEERGVFVDKSASTKHIERLLAKQRGEVPLPAPRYRPLPPIGGRRPNPDYRHVE